MKRTDKRLALTLPTVPMPAPIARTCLGLAREFIGHGYEEIWLAEVSSAESFALAGALSQAVPTARIGTGVLPLSTRSPMIHAMGALTLSELTEGRFALGLGISSEAIVRHWAGQPFDRPLVRMRESVTVIRQALAGQKTSVEGAAVRSVGLRLPAKAEVPILLGALNPSMLRLAGAIADGIVLNMVPESAIPRVVEEARRGAIEAGRDPASLEVVARLHVAITDTVETGRAAMRVAFGPYLATAGYNRFFRYLGYDAEMDALSRAFAAGDRAAVAAAMTDPICDAVGVTGPLAHVRSRVKAYADAGVDVLAINPISPDLEAQRAAFAGMVGALG